MPDDREQGAAGVVVPVADFAVVFDFLTRDVGFRVERIFPADDPRACTLVGFGCRLHLEKGESRRTDLRIEVDDRTLLERGLIVGPEGLNIEFAPTAPAMHLPPLVSALSVSRSDGTWHTGRAGMLYRDLVPDRQGGAVIASHIHIPGSGPVPDYVHFHDIAFQLIFCLRGTVTLVYEDRGEPFVLTAGDCVTQPPRIRHRVLESSDDLEVIEIGYPAEHVTRSDPAMHLPNEKVDPSRTWDGQSFVHHRHSRTALSHTTNGVMRSDTGVSAGTHGLAHVEQIDIESSTWECPRSEQKEFVFLFALDGDGVARVSGPGADCMCALEPGTALVVPVDHRAEISAPKHLSMLHVRIVTQ